MLILLVVGAVCGVIAIYIFWRNPLVYEFRIDILERDSAKFDRLNKSGQWQGGDLYFPTYSALPSYEAMLYKFWIWPLSRFLPKTENSNAQPGPSC